MTVLDVGHGNSAVIRQGEYCAIVDAAPGSTLLEFLASEEIGHIGLMIVSHADADHLAGVTELLLQDELTVDRVLVNPDDKSTAEWDEFRRAVADSKTRGTHVETSATPEQSPIEDGELRIEILAPLEENVLATPKGKDLKGRQLTSNGLSVVVRVVVAGIPELLLAGDIDDVGLANLVESGADLSCRTLVFPHHGGRPGKADLHAFAAQLCTAAKPDAVVFSFSRSRYENPQPGVVAGLRSAIPQARIACTQLSSRCADALPSGPHAHLAPIAAAGKPTDQCCAGSLRLVSGSGSAIEAPTFAGHQAFIGAAAPKALCLMSVADLEQTIV